MKKQQHFAKMIGNLIVKDLGSVQAARDSVYKMRSISIERETHREPKFQRWAGFRQSQLVYDYLMSL